MKSGTISDVGKQTKSLTQQIAKQVGQEPFEMLKRGGAQLNPYESSEKLIPSFSPDKAVSQDKNSDTAKMSQEDKLKSSRLMQALEAEIEDIRKERIFKEVQAKVQSGEQVSLESYPSLTWEQRQVLKAQIEVIAARKVQSEAQKPFSVSKSKTSRKFWGFGPKQKAQEMERRVERPVPPSG